MRLNKILMKRWKHFFSRGMILVMAVFMSSCARLPIESIGCPPREMVVPTLTRVPILRKDVYHVAAPGETVWRIAKMYDVDIKDIKRANRLRNTKEIEMGQRLIVPSAASLKPVVTLYPSKKWKYIIIHHSATDVGNALAFHGYHHRRGFENGLGYHFVVSNGTKGKEDGQIEVSPRWTKQQNGAHCKAANMNNKAIGVCLVGNFSDGRVSQDQMESLVYLVDRLRRYYKVPLKNIMGHGRVHGAQTECPGKKFPWTKFITGLKNARRYYGDRLIKEEHGDARKY
ncbi:MAG: LysM peptidoglycan-binding domain-containing protein [Candidatus Omnitrophica bacterium]|nr:LysM peptidoglycan-binding domain-containing protein [Candidatus Omnitrophota bacterium]